MKSFFSDKKILITGGTGSIGSEILKYLIPYNPLLIRIYSRDEYKQHKLRYKYTDIKNIEYVLGDIRDLESLTYAGRDIDIVFHCAALKQVPISEEMPEEFIKTNIIGAVNLKKVAIANKIPLVVSISTDKAVNPCNVMGLTKAVQEKIFSSHHIYEKKSSLKFINVRFGNVIGTHGSLFPIIYHQIKNNQPITITENNMTRFFMTSRDAIDLIFWAAKNGNDGETIIKKMKSIRINEVVKVFLTILKCKSDYPINVIGLRVGEKMHESLITEDEFYRVKERSGYFVIAPYTTKEIKANLISESGDRPIFGIKKFYSNFDSNFLSEKEMTQYVKDYIKAINLFSEII